MCHPPEIALASPGSTSCLCGAVGLLWETLVELWGGSGMVWRRFGGALQELWGAQYIEKLPINRTSGHYVTTNL